MEAQRFFHLLLILTWIFVFSSVCSGMHAPKLSLESTVFVAVEGENLTIDCNISKPPNKPKDTMKCFDPLQNQIFVCDLNATSDNITMFKLKLQLKMNRSGEYHCVYQSAIVYWFLRVRANGYERPPMLSYTEVCVAVFTGVLLVFSVVGSIYVFRGHWKEPITKSDKTSGKQRQNRGETETRETEEDVDKKTAPPTYASLQARPRSIYDVLDLSAANQEPDQRETKPNKNKHTEKTEQTTQPQADGVFESVYENF
ncbi:uncharacterized protein si:ch211-243a20.4 [Hippoglossus stenolepis]|uniref:uncharacterized protein si:ch211-243a20.4 n=1 Tax=Hippoglossus stenolepis TaxID=195615 RepID=UPI00159C38F1|nr:uncharacterized protein si:ch211-243a20.4 [Hippoglossus stenolepis]